MSDYLDGLLSRSFAPMGEVQPRLPAIFEPIKAMNAFPVASVGVEIDETREAPPSRSAAPARSAPTPTHPAVPATPSAQPPMTHAAPVKRPAEHTPVSIPEIRAFAERPAAPAEALPSSISVLPATSASVAPVSITATPPESPTENSLLPPTVPSSQTESIGSTAIPPPPEQHAPDIARTAALKAIHSPAHDEVERPRRTTPSPVSVLIRPVAPPPPTVSEVTRVSPPRLDRSSQRVEVTPAEPTIQITIGRIEVRAATPAAPAAARARTEPVLNLETYLQRRAEGGRR